MPPFSMPATQEAEMARKAKKAEPKPENDNTVEQVEQTKPADKDVPENFDQYRAKH